MAVAVGVGAVRGLCVVTAVAVNIGAKRLGMIPVTWVQPITGLILLCSACSAWQASRG